MARRNGQVYFTGNSYNSYNVRIAELRTRRYFEGAIKVARDYFGGGGRLKLDGFVLMLGGDLVSGTIHDELTATNEQSTMESVVHFSPMVSAGIGMLAEEFGRGHVISVPGNHDRTTRKVPAKRTATSAASWVFGKMLERDFQTSKDVTFDISPASDAYYDINGTHFVLTHGDQFRGGDGQVGALGPVKRGQLRKASRDIVLGRPNDIMVLGHFHQYVSAPGQGFVMNGAIKGFDEYAARLNCMPEPPQQALFIVTAEHGITFSAPILVMNRDKEGW